MPCVVFKGTVGFFEESAFFIAPLFPLFPQSTLGVGRAQTRLGSARARLEKCQARLGSSSGFFGSTHGLGMG